MSLGECSRKIMKTAPEYKRQLRGILVKSPKLIVWNDTHVWTCQTGNNLTAASHWKGKVMPLTWQARPSWFPKVSSMCVVQPGPEDGLLCGGGGRRALNMGGSRPPPPHFSLPPCPPASFLSLQKACDTQGPLRSRGFGAHASHLLSYRITGMHACW